MILEQPISAHDVGLKLHCPRFDRDVSEFFLFEAQRDNPCKIVNSPSWVNLITQIERTVIQVHTWDENNFDGTVNLRWRLNIRDVSPRTQMVGFKLPGAQIRGFGWKQIDDLGSMLVRVNFESCKTFHPRNSSLCF